MDEQITVEQLKADLSADFNHEDLTERLRSMDGKLDISVAEYKKIVMLTVQTGDLELFKQVYESCVRPFGVDMFFASIGAMLGVSDEIKNYIACNIEVTFDESGFGPTGPSSCPDFERMAREHGALTLKSGVREWTDEDGQKWFEFVDYVWVDKDGVEIPCTDEEVKAYGDPEPHKSRVIPMEPDDIAMLRQALGKAEGHEAHAT